MSKTLLNTLQVIEVEIQKLEARRTSLLCEADELKNAIKTLQKITEIKPKNSRKDTKKSVVITTENEVINEPNFN